MTHQAEQLDEEDLVRTVGIAPVANIGEDATACRKPEEQYHLEEGVSKSTKRS